MYYVEGENRWGRETAIEEPFKGILHDLKEKYQSTESPFLKAQIEKYMRYEDCPNCHGARLKKEALSITINGKSIVEFSDMSITDAFAFINNLNRFPTGKKKSAN